MGGDQTKISEAYFRIIREGNFDQVELILQKLWQNEIIGTGFDIQYLNQQTNQIHEKTACYAQIQFPKAGIGNLKYSESYWNTTGITYGLQRTRPKGFYWGVSFGPGIYFDDFDAYFIPFVDARLGWVLTKRK
ncbi:MAG TPA: hypothetical protein VFD35_13500 [Pricia sp.]|nr:hypothetical protein [Pricia sp.]